MDTAPVFRGSIPALYDEHLGPVIFQPYAEEMARRLAGLPLHRVLETAAGTGVVTRALAASLPGTVAIDATDLNQPMLDLAARRLPSPRITWRQADAQALPFPDGSFDAVLCQFGVMFFPDRPRAFAEARRVLKPGGRFLFSVWGKVEANDFADAVEQALAEFFPQDPPRFISRVPHGLHDTGPLEDELRAAGFTSVAVESIDRVSTAPDVPSLAKGFCQGTPLRHEIEARDGERLAEATAAVAAALEARFGQGQLRGGMRAHLVSAIR